MDPPGPIIVINLHVIGSQKEQIPFLMLVSTAPHRRQSAAPKSTTETADVFGPSRDDPSS